MSLHNIYYQTKVKQINCKILNRDIGWLQFNERVLQEAANASTPLLERLRFLAIFSSNLDEFYKVRVAALRRYTNLPKVAQAKLLFNPNHIIHEITHRINVQRIAFERIFEEAIKPELTQQNIFLIDEKALDLAQSSYVKEVFKAQILPFITPIILSEKSKTTPLKDTLIYLAVTMHNQKMPEKVQHALVGLPVPLLPRFWVLPSVGKKQFVLFLDDVLRHNLNDIFSPLGYDTYQAHTIKITRDAELDLESDVPESYIQKLSKSLKKRKQGQPIRLIYDQEIPATFIQILTKNLGIKKIELSPGGRYHNFRDFMDFPNLNHKELRYPTFLPIALPQVDATPRIFDAIKKQDILLHHPYQSFDYTVRFLREAAIDPQVVSIKITLYRVAKISNIVNSLVTAIMNGKKVTVVVELRARFDEESNIYYAERLKDAGATVIYGSNDGKKVHCKMCLVTRREARKLQQYAHLSTGNYNGNTAQVYCDDALLTADKRLTADVAKLFNYLEKPQSIEPHFDHLLVAPKYLRSAFYKLIDREIAHAKQKKLAYIQLKMNSLTDFAMIAKLYEAAEAGVKIQIIVRGACSLIGELYKNITVISIIDRFLEHSRIYVFGNAGQEVMYLASADCMERNLSNRIEIAYPIYQKKLQKQLKKMIDIQLNDNQKARHIADPTQNTQPQNHNNAPSIRAQVDIYAFLQGK